MAKTGIVCTIGPASSKPQTLTSMMHAGMSVARINFSHGETPRHQSNLDLIRRLNKRLGKDVKILQDLEGYRIRVGAFKGGKPLQLKKRQILLLTNRDILGDRGIVPFDYTGPLSDIKPGTHIYIDDGNIVLLAKGHRKDYLKAEVVIAGLLREQKGINMPDVKLQFRGLTHKDKVDLEFGITNKVEYIAQSFVRDKNDILHLKD
ncbi:MAG: pyruvate kinase, partial [Deltaproteobacteria bacterium]